MTIRRWLQDKRTLNQVRKISSAKTPPTHRLIEACAAIVNVGPFHLPGAVCSSSLKSS